MLRLFRKDPRARLEEVIGGFELPVFRRSTLEVLRRLRDPKSSPGDVAQLVRVDPGLTVRVLKTVNSAAYSPRKRVESLDQAVVMLGAMALEQLVMSLAVREGLPAGGCESFCARRFWATAARRATVAKALAERVSPKDAADCFTGALLQDMAVPLLAHARAGDYGPVLQAWLDGDVARLDELERNEFGWDHAQVGTWMAELWGFPPRLVAAVGGHHGERKHDCQAEVRLAGHLHEIREEEGIERLIEGASAELGLSRDDAMRIVAESETRGAELALLLG